MTEATTRFIPWVCSVCNRVIEGEALVEMKGMIARHKPECPPATPSQNSSEG